MLFLVRFRRAFVGVCFANGSLLGIPIDWKVCRVVNIEGKPILRRNVRNKKLRWKTLCRRSSSVAHHCVAIALSIDFPFFARAKPITSPTPFIIDADQNEIVQTPVARSHWNGKCRAFYFVCLCIVAQNTKRVWWLEANVKREIITDAHSRVGDVSLKPTSCRTGMTKKTKYNSSISSSSLCVCVWVSPFFLTRRRVSFISQSNTTVR